MTDEPQSLAALLHWYRGVVGDRIIPIRIHNRDTDDGGYLQWHGAFRAYLTAHPMATDREGFIRDPLAFHLWQMAGKGAKGNRRAEFLYRLACLDFDWLAAVHARPKMSGLAVDMCEAYAHASLRILWRMCQSEPVKFERKTEKSEAQLDAEEAA